MLQCVLRIELEGRSRWLVSVDELDALARRIAGLQAQVAAASRRHTDAAVVADLVGARDSVRGALRVTTRILERLQP